MNPPFTHRNCGPFLAFPDSSGLEAKMRLSIMFKSTAVLIFSILIGSLAIFFISRHFMHDGFDHSIHAQLLTVRQVVDGTYAHAKKALLQEAKMLASEKELTEAIKGNNKQAITDFAKTAMKQCEANFVMILDNQGVVLARGHSPNSGDSFAEFDIVRVALSGQALAEAVDLKKSGLSVGAAAPIRSDGKQIGVILLGNAFHTHAFVDEIKKITGMEMTIFDGDQRISTTITNNGQRAVGTKLNNPAVQSAVLQNGTTYAAPANILGKAYRTVYWPIKESSGKILGMWFIGTSVEVVKKTVDDIAFYCFIAVLVVVVVLSLLGFLFFRNLVTPLKHSVNYAKAVSEGDLDATLFVKPRKDEVGDLVQALQHMVSTLKDKITEADKATAAAKQKGQEAEQAMHQANAAALEAQNAKREGMHAAAGQLDSVVHGLSTAANELSAQIEESDHVATESSNRLSEAATAMNEMNATVQEVARNASSAASVSAETRRNAEDGQKILTDAMNSINQVQKVSLELQDDMQQLHGHTQSISQIMNVISDIADQTNLLALNAAIEAARAGEAGRGFAVVADEVRKLAEKTMASTNDVSKAITSIQNSAQKSVDKMSEALEAVEQATSLAQQSGEALQQIVRNVEDTADQVRAIATAAEEQSAASEEINQSVTAVNSMSGQTATAMDEATKAIAELAQQTEKLASLVEHMKSE